MSAIQCKQLIDEEVLQYNSHSDEFVRTIIAGKRAENVPLSNSVLILLDDNNMDTGRDWDGMVYYDFDWNGSGNEATRYQQRKIPEIVANETTLTIEWNIVPIRQLGPTIYDAIQGFDPFGLYPTDPEKQKAMQLKELKNGRLAMVAIGGMVAGSSITGHGFPYL